MPVTVDLSRVRDCLNPVYRDYLIDFRYYQIFKGGAGAGKSIFAAQKIVYNFIARSGYNVLCVRKSSTDNHNSTYAEIVKCINAWRLGGLFEINHSRGRERIRNKWNGNEIIFRGMDDREKVKSVTFVHGDLTVVWVEEASEIDEEDFFQLDLRLRGKGPVPKHFILTFNPIDIDSFIKPRFFDNPLPTEDGFILQTTYKDNEFLDDRYKARLEKFKDIDDHYYRVYVLNEWGIRSTATVFHNLVIEDFEVKEQDLSGRRFGMDFGYNHANALQGVGYKDGELYIWWENWAKHQLNEEFIKSVETTGLQKDYTIKADSAEPDKIAQWQKAGYRGCFPTDKFNGSVRRGVDYLRGLPKIHIHKTRCPNAAREFPRFRYRQLKDGRILDTEFVEIDDDTVAAVRYASDDRVREVEGSHFFIKRRK